MYLVGGLVGQGWLEGEEAQEDEGPRRIRATPKAVPGSLGEPPLLGVTKLIWLVWAPHGLDHAFKFQSFSYFLFFLSDLVFGIGD